MSKSLPRDLTSYDLLKSAAVLLMIVDHVGHYFFTDVTELRMIGRMCVPVWMFLMGYAQTREISAIAWAGGVILVACNFVVGISLFPLNILFTFIMIRLAIDPLMRGALKNLEVYLCVNAVLLVLSIPTAFLTEYGTEALVLAMFGYVARRGDLTIRGLKGRRIFLFLSGLVAWAGFSFSQMIFFDFSTGQRVVVAAGLGLVFLLLAFFRPVAYPRLTAACSRSCTAILQFMGRRSLEIYVVHLILFKFMAFHLHPETYRLFRLVWFPELS